jgi:hypothetical protein
MRIQKTFYCFLLLLLFASLVSCGSKETEELETGDENIELINDKKITAQNIFNNIPDPNVMNGIIDESKLEYDGSLLNEPSFINKYSTDDYKAMNLGVYGTDLSYTSVFQQTQESIIYLKCVNQLCKNLGITGAFDERTADRFEINKENRDSLLTIITGAFNGADKYLRENQRPHASALLVAGGWVEGIYIATQIGKSSKSLSIAKQLEQQAISLKDLITFLDAYKVDDDGKFMIEDLKSLQAPFDSLASKLSQPSLEMNENVFEPLCSQVQKLRAKIVQNP